MPEFVPGQELSGLFYAEAVAPILAEAFPQLRHSAALIGYGSEVLGYDTARSTDHEWGPRLLLFVSEEDYGAHRDRIIAVLAERLPATFRGYSTHFGPPDDEGVRLPQVRETGPVDHKVEVLVAGSWFDSWLGIDPVAGLSVVEWLVLPQQKLLEVTAGRVYHDGLGELEPRRAALAAYPHEVWLYVLACQWRRIAQQEAFVGRTGEVGDELGSGLVAATLVRDLMRLCFLMERRYAPYTKWFGTAFRRLACAAELGPVFQPVLAAARWQEREEHLCVAYEVVARLQNELGLARPVEGRTSRFHGRPFRVIHGDRFVAALAEAIVDPEVKGIVERVGWVGAIDQMTDNVDVLSSPERYRGLRALYE
ncbi:MAG: hypothetical protein QOF73_4843 [Thermomicrobiales bacterium]|nr:hypothetical protein [Thermomicrobiales bacterium]